MANQFENKIQATDKNISDLMKGQKFFIDYFQREYRWDKRHILTLLDDLISAFFKSYADTDKRTDVRNYHSYYLGSAVFNVSLNNGKKSVIDGQQRLTSVTLLLIFLNHLQSNRDEVVNIRDLIFSEKYGEKSFNMTDSGREACLKALFEEGEYEVTAQDDETVLRITERYSDIVQSFPEELTGRALPFFINWLIQNVVIVEIIAYSDDNAYTIFETMNDRGLNLTPTEMLKGYVLSQIRNINQRQEINELWKKKIQELHQIGANADLSFFQAWFRGKYAQTIRVGKAGAENRDFEHIATKYHKWFKDNHKTIFNLNSPDDFYEFFKEQFPFFVDCYKTINRDRHRNIPHLEYIRERGIAESLQEPLLLAALEFEDEPIVLYKKIDFVARFIETFIVKKSVNFKKFGQTTIKYHMFGMIKKIRGIDIDRLSNILISEVESIEQQWDGILSFGLHGQNRKFVKHLLARISAYLDDLAGKTSGYSLFQTPEGRQYEIEHIWSNHFDEHTDEFEQEHEFLQVRNQIGALLLLPNGTNQSFGSNRYEDKLNFYIRENTLAQSLHPDFYQRNPNFLNNEDVQNIGFTPHPHFKKQDILNRQELIRRICEKIWSVNYFRRIP